MRGISTQRTALNITYAQIGVDVYCVAGLKGTDHLDPIVDLI